MKAFLVLLLLICTSDSVFALDIALNWKPEPQFGGFYAALKNGYFKAENLDVQLLEGGAGTPTIQMVAAGKAPFGVVSADELLVSRNQKSDVVALFAVYQKNPQGILTHVEKNFLTLGQVFKTEGQLSLQSGLPYAMFLKKKYSPLKVKLVPYLGGLTNFLVSPNLSQQCFVTSEPFLASKKGVKTKTFLVADSGFNPYTTVLVTTRKYLDNNRTTVEKLVRAVRKGWENYLKDSQPTNRYMSTLNKTMDLETFQSSSEAQKDLIETAETKKSGLGSMTSSRWLELIDQLKDLGLLKSKVVPEDVFVTL